MGPTLDEMEKIVITKPTIIRIPPCMWHSPLDFKRMTKPILFQAAFLAGCWGTVYRIKDQKGNPVYAYTGDNVRFCKVRPGEKCTICGKCMPQVPTLGDSQ